ncbi:MAG: lactonase family protein [Planctomycetaceae bacterium]
MLKSAVLMMLPLLITPLLSMRAVGAEPVGKWLVYVGTYAGAKDPGIFRLELNVATGEMTKLGETSGVANPSFLAIHPTNRSLYAVSEISDIDGKKTGGVAAFSIDPKDGALTAINVKPSGGPGPCHLNVDREGKNILVANYGGGSVAVLPIVDGGGLKEPSCFIQHEGSSVNPGRQAAPHGHSINLDLSGKRAFAADLGLDKVLIYNFDATAGTLTPNHPAAGVVAPGSGPRHFDFHPTGKFAYVINEMGSTVTAFSYNSETGSLTELQTISTLPDDFKGNNSTADIHVHPSGRFLYGSNRGHDSIVVYTIDESTGKLTWKQHQSTLGKTPRNFGIDPTGRILLAENQGSDSIYSFHIDANTGELKATGHSIEIPRPVCVRFVPWPIP